MKITQIKPFIMWGGDAGGTDYSSTLWGEGAGRNWLFVKIETDEGIYGWGEGSLVNQTPTIAKAVQLLADQVIGQDPAGIERHWQVMFLHNRYRGGVIINSALSAIDQALWDIKGKLLGTPVYQLLGGAVRERIRAYSGAGSVETARKRVEQGFTAIKTHAWYTDHEIEERKVVPWLRDHLAGLREVLGPDVDVMVDNHGRSRPALAIKQIRAVEEFGLLFFEEPVPPDNLDSLAVVRQAGLQTELAAGERLFNRWGYKDLIQRQLADVIQPDICHCGGISEMRRIAALAEMYGIQVAPHNPKGPVATAASVHVSAAIPNFLILEHTHPNPLFEQVQVEPMKMRGGCYDLPTAPGLGVDLREEVIAASPFRDRPVIQAFWDDGTPAHP
jgi:galactonate dehydratase